jgi:uncharacterized membrane protein (TIGR02234 family)
VSRRIGSRAACFVAGAAGAALALVASGRDWIIVALPGNGSPLPADGRAVAPGGVAVALVSAVGVVVLVTAGRVGRLIVAGLLVLAGAGLVALSVPAWSSPLAAAEPALTRVTGTVGRLDGATATATAWPAVSAGGGLLVAAAGMLGVVRGRRWPGPARRYELPDASAAAASGPEPVRDGDAPSVRAARSPAAERDRRTDAWDSLSRGEDPTDPA